MTEGYLENHFGEIIGHESEIEKRFVDTGCTVEGLKADNRRNIDGFLREGEQVSLIEDDYDSAIRAVLDAFPREPRA